MDEYFDDFWAAVLAEDSSYGDNYSSAQFKDDLLNEAGFADEMYAYLKSVNSAHTQRYSQEDHNDAIFGTRENILLQQKYPKLNLSSLDEPKKEKKEEKKPEKKKDDTADELYRNFGIVVTEKGSLMPGDKGYEAAEQEYLKSKKGKPITMAEAMSGEKISLPDFNSSIDVNPTNKYKWTDGTYHDTRESIISPGTSSKFNYTQAEKDYALKDAKPIPKDKLPKSSEEKNAKVDEYFESGKGLEFNPNKTKYSIAEPLRGLKGSHLIQALQYDNANLRKEIERSDLQSAFWGPKAINWLSENLSAFDYYSDEYQEFLKQQEARDWREAHPDAKVSLKYTSPDYPDRFKTGGFMSEPMTDATYMRSMENLVYKYFNEDPAGQKFYQSYMANAADILQDEYKEGVYRDFLAGHESEEGMQMSLPQGTGEIDPATGIERQEYVYTQGNPVLAQVATKMFVSDKTWNNVTNQISAGGRFTKSDASEALEIQQYGWRLKKVYEKELLNLTSKLYKESGIYTEKGYKAAAIEAKRLLPIAEWENGAFIRQNQEYQKFLKSKLGGDAINVPVMIWGFDQDTGKRKLISKDSENLSDAQIKELERVQELYDSVTSGMFTNDNIETTLSNLEYELLYSLMEIGQAGFMEGKASLGGAALYEQGYDIDGIKDQGEISYLVREMSDVKDMKKWIANANNKKVLGALTLMDNPSDNPLINFFNSKLQTYRALGEAYVMNYNPVETLVTGEGDDVSFWENPLQWQWETLKSLYHGVSTSKEGFFNIDEYTQDDFNVEFVESLEGPLELTPYTDTEKGKLEYKYKEKYVDVDMAVRIGRTLPTFGAMAVEIASIELATGGFGTAGVAAKSPLYLRRLYQAWGAGRKTSKVMAGVSRQFVKESINLHGSNYLGSTLWGRDEMPVYSFAAGSTFAHFGMGSLGRAWKLFGRSMKRNTTPAGALWRTANNAFEVTPNIVKMPLMYPAKKFTQAGMGVVAIKSGEFTSGLYDVATTDLTMSEMWKHVSNVDSLIELFGTMLAMGAKSGLKDTANGIKGVFGDFKKLSSPYTTKVLNKSVLARWSSGEFGLGKKMRFNKNRFEKDWKESGEGDFGGESFWGKLEIEAKQNELLAELKELSSEEIQQKYGVKTFEQARDIIISEGNALKVNQQIQFYRANQTRIEQSVLGRKSFFGEFNGVMRRFRKNQGALDLQDRLTLGEIASFSEYNKVVHEVMSKTNLNESQAQALVKGAIAMAEAVGQLGFKKGSKLENRFLDISQKQSDISAEKESLKRALERGDINEANYKLRLEELNELSKEYIETEKKIIAENEKEIVNEIKQQEKRKSGNKVVVAEEGKTVGETAKELGLDKYEISEHEYGIQTTRKNPKTGKAESVIIIDPVKASTAQKRFFDSGATKTWRNKIIELKDAFDKGKISEKVFERQLRRAEKELSKAEVEQEAGLLESLTKGEARIDRAANREVLFHEEVHPIVEKYVDGPQGKKLVNDFIGALKESGAYDAVWNKLKNHTEVQGNKNYKGSEWFTVFGELAKSGKLEELFKAQKNLRVWDNFASLITKGVRENTSLKDYKITDGLSALEFIKNFAKGETKAGEAAVKATEEYLEWAAENPKLNKAAFENVNLKDVEGDMIELYEAYKDTWNEGGSMEALKEMAKKGLLSRLIGAKIPYPRPKGWTQKVNDAFIRDVYGEMTQLISGFKESKQTTSGSKGFFAYVNSFLNYKALNVLKEMGVFDKTKSLEQMKEDKGFDLTAPEASTEVYTPKTSAEVSKDLSLTEKTIKELDKELSQLESKELVEAYDTPAGRNQTISPFIREFKKQYGKLGQKVIAKNMGKSKAEYKTYLENNFAGIVNNLPVGYVSRNFPYLVEKGKHAGTTGRDTRWTSGPKGIKIKENFTEKDVRDFIYDLTEVGRLSTKKNALAYQLADSYGIKKFTEAIENQRASAEKLLTLEGDFELSKNEYAENKISEEEFNKRKSEYLEKASALLKESNIIDNFNKELSPEEVSLPKTTAEKLSQQIEISNFRKSAVINISLREIAEKFSEKTGELKEDAYIEAFTKFQDFKPKLVQELLKRKKGVLLDAKDYREAFKEVYGDMEFLPGFKLSKDTWSKAAKAMRGEREKIDQGYKISKLRQQRSNKNNKTPLKELEFKLEKEFDRAFGDIKEIGNLQKIVGVKIKANKEILKEEQLNENILHEENYWINKLNNTPNKVEAVKQLLKYHLGHYASSGKARGYRGQFYSGKPDVYKELNNTLKDLGLDIEIKWKESKSGGLKPGSTYILKGGKEVVGAKELAEYTFQHPQSAHGKWLKLTDQEWVNKNPEKVEELIKEWENRNLESKDNQNELLEKIEFDYASWKLGQISDITKFLALDQYNTNMQGMLRAAAGLHSIMKPHEGDIVDVLTLEHMRAAQVMIEGIATIAERGDSWVGLDAYGNKTKNLNEIINYEFTNEALTTIKDLFKKYNTAIVTQEKTGLTIGESVDALLSLGHKTKEPLYHETKAFGKGGELYSRLFNEFNFGSERARSMMDLAEFKRTKDVEKSLYGKEHDIAARLAKNEIVKAADKKLIEQTGLYNKSSLRGKTIKDLVEIAESTDKALDNARKINPKVKKARVFDFDDTVARTKSKVFAEKDGKRIELTAEEFAKKGDKLVNEGWKMDFSDFNKVVKGKKGPLFDLMKKMKEAEGERDLFILTARAQESAPAIHEFLKQMGIDIPLENIKGLGNSTGDAKAEWILNKAKEGYNDFYFADDAIQNVEAVKKVLDQIDVKSKVQQARVNKSSVEMDNMFNKIIEGKTGIEWQKEFSEAKGKVRGAKKGKYKFWIPPSAEDFSGLMDMTLGKGKEGEAQRAWYGEVLYKPYSRAQRSLSNDRINLMSDFKKLKKDLNIPKDLREITESGFSKEQAVRVHLWNKLGYDIPGISKTDLAELSKIVESDANLNAFAEQILNITKGDGYAKPGKEWLAGTITTDFMQLLNTTKRSKYLQEWQANVDVLFSKKNLNKLEAAYGPKYREALENSLARMKAGKNRIQSGNRLSDRVLDYINNAQGTIMFFNIRSAVLQQLSAVNFMNVSFNNPVKMGKAFANQPQYWKDFMELMNSDYLVDRRNGLKINIAESEIADAAATSKNKAKAAINYILEKGYLPTKFMDSFAIASGGATWYRNRINSLIKKEGLTREEAKKKAYEEFIDISEKSQQSSDPSKISQQQAGDMGRILLQFVNTPMQYARLQKAEFKDIVNRRGNPLEKVGKILYYGAIQNLWFNFMQQGLFALGFDDEIGDEETESKVADGVNGMADSILRGLGLAGMTTSVLKNFLIDVYERSGRKQPKYKESLFKLLEFSPAIKSKFSKLSTVAWMMEDKVTRNQMMNEGFSLENPAWKAAAKILSATVNLPLDRAFQKLDNVRFAMEEETETWQSVFAWLGWPEYQLTNQATKDAKRQKEKDDLHYREALEDPSKYTKEEQIDILKQHGYSDEEIKNMKNEGTRVATIKHAEQESHQIYTSQKDRGKKPKTREDKTYTPYIKDSERDDISDADKKTNANVKKYMDMTKAEQVKKLDSLGYAKWYIRSLSTEQDRVDVLLKDIENDSIPDRLRIPTSIPKSKRTPQQNTLYNLNKSQQLDTLKILGVSDSLANALKYEAERVAKIEELYKERDENK